MRLVTLNTEADAEIDGAVKLSLANRGAAVNVVNLVTERQSRMIRTVSVWLADCMSLLDLQVSFSISSRTRYVMVCVRKK